MGTDLVSACVFCAGLLFGLDRAPAPGWSGEFVAAYSTLSRLTELPGGRRDTSDVTPKFVAVSLGNALVADEDLGAGTPSREWRLRAALAPSHDEQGQRPAVGVDRTVSTGTGRFENFAMLLRWPLGERDSIELGATRKMHSATDLVNFGGQNFTFSEERVLSAERIDAGVGLRHRWRGFEAAASFRAAAPSSSTATAGAFYISNGTLWGGAVDARARTGRWTFTASAQENGGTLSVHEESAPEFASRNFDADARFESYRAAIGYSFGKRDALLSGAYDRARVPFSSLAVLGVETEAFDRGFHPDSRTRLALVELSVRRAFGEAHVRVFLRSDFGRETVRLTDSAGKEPPRDLDVQRSGNFGNGLNRALGSPQIAFGFGVDFRIPGK